MAETTVPEIQRTSLLTAVLYLKSLPLDLDVLNFDFVDAPSVRPHRLIPANACKLEVLLAASKQ